MRVLLADQHPDIRLALALLLSKEPGVMIVGSVSEAEGLLALAQTTRPDIVVLDSQLPGRALAEILAGLHDLKQPPKLLLLGEALPPVLQLHQTNQHAIVSKNDPPELLRKKFRTLFVA